MGVAADADKAVDGSEHSWGTCKTMLGRVKMESFATYDKDAITPTMLAKLEPIVVRPEFTPDAMAAKHGGLRFFCTWARDPGPIPCSETLDPGCCWLCPLWSGLGQWQVPGDVGPRGDAAGNVASPEFGVLARRASYG